MYVTGSNFIYNSMQMQVKRQMKGGGLLNVAYTWSRALTDASAYNEQPMDSYNFKTERGLTTYNRSHVFVFSYIYPLPFWRTGTEWYKIAFGGWQISGVTTHSDRDCRSISASTPIRPASAKPASVRMSSATGHQNCGHALPVVQHGCLRAAGGGHVRQPGPQCPHRAGPEQLGCFAAEVLPLHRTREPAVPRRVLQCAESSFLVGRRHDARCRNFGQITSATDPRSLQFGLRLTF